MKLRKEIETQKFQIQLLRPCVQVLKPYLQKHSKLTFLSLPNENEKAIGACSWVSRKNSFEIFSPPPPPS